MSPEAFGTVLAALIASLTGVGAYLTSRRTSRLELAASESVRLAEVNQAEITGWKTLIETLMGQYKDASTEVGTLTARLRDGNLRFEMISRELRDAHIKLAVQDERITVLRAEVTKLGGDVDEINRVGKRGAKGPDGEQGEQGPPGEPGQ